MDFNNNFNLPITVAGNYQLIEFKDAACTGQVAGTGQVNEINIEVDIEIVDKPEFSLSVEYLKQIYLNSCLVLFSMITLKGNRKKD